MLRRLLQHHDFMQTYLLAFIGRALTRPGFIFMVFATFTAILSAAALFYWIEKDVNPHLGTFIDALYFTTSTFTTVGYGDISPVTQLGRGLAIGMMLVGSLIYVSFTAIVSTTIIELDLRHRGFPGSEGTPSSKKTQE